MSRVPVSRRVNKVNFLAGSERLLRVHHKNSVFSRDLQHCLEKLDVTCRKNLNKLQQTIFDVYYDEFVPIREEASALKLPKLPLTVRNVSTGDRNTGVVIIEIPNGRREKTHTSSLSNDLSNIKDGTPEKQRPFTISGYRHSVATNAPTNCSMNQRVDLPPIQRNCMGSMCNHGFDKTGSFTNSDTEDSPDVDSKTLHRIKNAIALTSQPSKPKLSKKEKMLRKSFLLSLRKTSKSVWHSEMLLRVDGDINPPERQLMTPKTTLSESREAKLAKLLMLSTSEEDDTSLDKSEALTVDATDEGRQSSLSTHYANIFQMREKTLGSDISSDNDICPESPTYFSEISEEPSFLSDMESDTSYYTQSDSASI